MRARGKVCSGAVQREHLIDEGGADAEGVRDLNEGLCGRHEGRLPRPSAASPGSRLSWPQVAPGLYLHSSVRRYKLLILSGGNSH